MFQCKNRHNFYNLCKKIANKNYTEVPKILIKNFFFIKYGKVLIQRKKDKQLENSNFEKFFNWYFIKQKK